MWLLLAVPLDIAYLFFHFSGYVSGYFIGCFINCVTDLVCWWEFGLMFVVSVLANPCVSVSFWHIGSLHSFRHSSTASRTH